MCSYAAILSQFHVFYPFYSRTILAVVAEFSKFDKIHVKHFVWIHLLKWKKVAQNIVVEATNATEIEELIVYSCTQK